MESIRVELQVRVVACNKGHFHIVALAVLDDEEIPLATHPKEFATEEEAEAYFKENLESVMGMAAEQMLRVSRAIHGALNDPNVPEAS